MTQHTRTEIPLHELVTRRASPLAFASTPVSNAELRALLEAARWAASCFNEQPWRFVVARRDREPEAWERLASCIVPANRVWSDTAPLLMLSVASNAFARNGKPNRHAYHDVGLAVGNLTLQATALGLALHQMGGFDVEAARERLAIPAGHDPIAMIAAGRPGAVAALSEELRARAAAPRARKPLAELAFGGTYGAPLVL